MMKIIKKEYHQNSPFEKTVLTPKLSRYINANKASSLKSKFKIEGSRSSGAAFLILNYLLKISSNFILNWLTFSMFVCLNYEILKLAPKEKKDITPPLSILFLSSSICLNGGSWESKNIFFEELFLYSGYGSSKLILNL